MQINFEIASEAVLTCLKRQGYSARHRTSIGDAAMNCDATSRKSEPLFL
jgi:hypothetical protein